MRAIPWALDPPLRLLYIGTQAIDERWDHRLNDPFWRLYLNDRGGAEVFGDGWSHRLEPGRMHLLPAWCGAKARCRGRVGHDYLHVDCGDWGRRAFVRPLAVALPAEQQQAFSRICRGEVLGPVDRARARAIAAACIAAAVAALEPDALAELDPESDPRDPVARAKRLLAERLAEALPLAQVAAAVGLSPGHLRARFRAASGRTPMAWLRERRVAAAAERLIAGDEPIEAVAEACGFADRFHFSRIFARLVGCGPAAYRRSRRGGDADIPQLRPTPGA